MSGISDKDTVILDYLAKRGHHKIEAALRLELENDPRQRSTSSTPSNGGKQIGLEEFNARNTPRPASGASNGNRNAGALLVEPPSWATGYQGCRSFVENSLDIHRPELNPILLPLFVHSYLDLVLSGYREAADHFMATYSPDHAPSDPQIIRLLRSIRLPNHIQESEEATRWRRQRYNVKLSERGWGLMLGWLQGGGLVGSIEGSESRGRDRVLAIINERVKVDTVSGPPSKTPTDFGLLSELIGGKVNSKSYEGLKLGPAIVDPKLDKEVTRIIKNEDALPDAMPGTGETDPIVIDFVDPDLPESGLTPLISPQPFEIPPYPVTLRTLDVSREVEKVRESRKRIKLGGLAYSNLPNPVTGELTDTGVGKPSVCLFTIHDVGESLICSRFSEDSTLMGAGFSESYIRLWNLKGGKLAGLRNDFDSDDITDAAGLRRLQEKNAPTTRKLIGHSGPVYALSFDPVPGASGPPRYLLSASQDATIRLWSLDSYKNLVVYKGHREPVWDVEWGPKGIYFASASRDRTARLWSSDKTAALRIFVGHLSDVNCVRFHPNSLYLATGSSDRTCRLWDVQKGMCVRVFVGHSGSVTCIAVSPDGRYLASGADDLKINLWDLATGACIKSMLGHTAPIHSLSFSAESTVLISSSADTTVRVWDVLKPTSTELVRQVNGVDSKEGKNNSGDREVKESSDLLTTLATKKTTVLNVHFTPRNLCLASGNIENAN